MSGEDPSLARAADVLARLVQHRLAQRAAPPVPLAAPVELVTPRVRFSLGGTTLPETVRALGRAHPYPARGWSTFVLLEEGERRLLSAFYREARLIGVEYYVPKQRDGGPPGAAVALEPVRLEPLGVRLGSSSSALPAAFAIARAVPQGVVFEEAYEAVWPGGVVYAMANGGRVERLALYAQRP